MKIEQLIKAVNESVSNEAFNTAVNPNSPLGRAQAAEKEKADAAAQDNIVQFPRSTTPPDEAPVVTTQPTSQRTAAPSKFKQATQAVGSALKTGAQAVAKNAPAVGQGVSNVAKGLGSAGTGIVKGIGDIASQAVGGATQAVGAGLGGAVHGYKAARAGQQFGGGGTAGAPGAPVSSGGSATSPQSAAGADAGGSDELAQLKSTLQTMDQRLRRAGI
jgi:hypothetical protein